jgi:hypothetical protein
MPIEPRTTFSKLELDANGAVGIRVLKELVNADTGVVISQEYHRTAVNPSEPRNPEVVKNGGDAVFATVAQQIEAMNAHLNAMGFPAADPILAAKVELLLQIFAAPADIITAQLSVTDALKAANTKATIDSDAVFDGGTKL